MGPVSFKRLQELKSATTAHGPKVAHFGGQHRLTAATLVSLSLLFWNVPQLCALISLPALHPGPTWWARAGLLVLRTTAIAGYAILWLVIFPSSAHDPNTSGRAPRLRWLEWQLEQKMGKRLDVALGYFTHRALWSLTFLTLALALSLWPIVVGGVATPHPLTFHFALLAAWTLPLTQRSVDRGLRLLQTPQESIDTAKTVIGRSLTLMLATNAVGELLWALQPWLAYGLAYRAYSSWAVVQVLFLVLVAVRAIDLLARLGVQWIRTRAAVVVVLALCTVPAGETIGNRAVHSSTLATAAAQAVPTRRPWLEQLTARLDDIPPQYPVLLVAASGGGSRAAIFASLVYEKLKLMPATLDLATSAGYERRSLADNVLVISSVSGGSLASAYFVAPPKLEPTIRHRSLFYDSIQRALKQHDQTEALNPLQSAFVDDMATDFMAPLLRGVLNILQERGTSVSNFWQERYGWRGLRDGSPVSPKKPLVLFNATSIRTGSRVTFGFPALEAGVLSPALAPADIDPDTTVSLAEAVRVSANFPYGFDYALLDVNPSARPNMSTDEQQLIDGGVVDNTGLDTFALLFHRLAALAGNPNSNAERSMSARSREVLTKLRQHGVLLLEIDAGARPNRPGWLAERFPSVSKPLEAMEEAAHQNASVIRETNIENLRRSIVDGESVQVPAMLGVVRAGFDCQPKGDVMTAWALDTADMVEIFVGFRQIEPRLTRALKTQVAVLAKLHAARRATLGTAKTTDATAANQLRIIFDEYLKQSMQADASQRRGAVQCKVDVARKKDWDADYDVDLRCELGETNACRPGQHVVAEPASAALASADKPGAPPPGEAEPEARGPVGSGAAALAPQRSTPKVETKHGAGTTAALEIQRGAERQELGWVYLGMYKDGVWVRRHAHWGRAGLPAAGDAVRLDGRSNVRTGFPNDVGELAPVYMTLRPETSVQVIEVRRWQDTNLVWARVRGQLEAPAGSASSPPAAH